VDRGHHGGTGKKKQTHNETRSGKGGSRLFVEKFHVLKGRGGKKNRRALKKRGEKRSANFWKLKNETKGKEGGTGGKKSLTDSGRSLHSGGKENPTFPSIKAIWKKKG